VESKKANLPPIQGKTGARNPPPGAQGEQPNPFKFIELALNEAKGKIDKMKATPQVLESLTDGDKKKKFLRAENKLLRENLKRMSDNVNVLIEKMNAEAKAKKNEDNSGIPVGTQTGAHDGGG
jgi:hypothetical protein